MKTMEDMLLEKIAETKRENEDLKAKNEALEAELTKTQMAIVDVYEMSLGGGQVG